MKNLTDDQLWQKIRKHLESDGQVFFESNEAYIAWEGDDLDFYLEIKHPEGNSTIEHDETFYPKKATSKTESLQSRLSEICPANVWEFM